MNLRIFLMGLYVFLLLVRIDSNLIEPVLNLDSVWTTLATSLIIGMLFGSLVLCCMMLDCDKESTQKTFIKNAISNKVLSVSPPSIYYTAIYTASVFILCFGFEMYFIAFLGLVIGCMNVLLTINIRKWYNYFNTAELKMMEIKSRK